MSRGTLDSARFGRISRTGLSLSLAGFPKTVLLSFLLLPAVRNPMGKPMVWALPISLAATFGIDLSFSSSPYLDGSVQAVPPAWLWIYHAVTEVRSAGLPHSDIHGS